MQEKKEKENIPEKVQSKEHSKNVSPLECLTCGKTFTGAQSQQEHLSSEKHLKKVRDGEVLHDQSPAEGNKCIVPKTEENSQNEKPKSEDLYCEVCQKGFTGAQSQQEHLKSEKHLKRVSQYLEGSTPSLHCAPCNKVFSGQESLQQHLNSKKHLNMVRV